MSRCRACGAELVWAKTENGKRMPLNPGKKVVGVVSTEDLFMGLPTVRLVSGLEPHWATCPSADQFRKGAEG